MKSLTSNDTYHYLGVPTGYQVKATPTGTIADLLEDLRRTDLSHLTPWQKIETVAVFLLPRLDFIMQERLLKGPTLSGPTRRSRRSPGLGSACLRGPVPNISSSPRHTPMSRPGPPC